MNRTMEMEVDDRSSANSMGSTLLGLVLGILIGGTFALMVAPQSGQETLSMLNDRGNDIKGRMTDKASSVKNRISDTAGGVKDQVSGFTGEVQKRAKNVMAATRGGCNC